MSKSHVRLLVAAGVGISLCCGVAQAAKQIVNTAYSSGISGANPWQCAAIEVGIQANATGADDPLSNRWCATEYYWKFQDGTNSPTNLQFYHCNPNSCSNTDWCPQDGTTENSYYSHCNNSACVDDEDFPINSAGGACLQLTGEVRNVVATIPLPKAPNVPGGIIEIWVKLVAEQDCKGTEGPAGVCSQTHDSSYARIDGVFHLPGGVMEFSAGPPTALQIDEGDSDGDGTADGCDACPNNPTKDRVIGCCGCGSNACDGTNLSDPNSECDYDGDGVPNCADECWQNSARVCVGECGCDYEGDLHCGPANHFCGESCPIGPGGHGGAVGDGDGDGMGTCQGRKPVGHPGFFCVEDPSCWEPEGPFCTETSPFKQDVECAQLGDLPYHIDQYCSQLQNCYEADSDGDCTLDCHDHCPLDVLKTQPGICGCNWADVDTDGDGTYDCPCAGYETCVTDADCAGGDCVDCGSGGGFGASCSPGDRVCVIEDTCGDYCPTDANKLVPGICGCEEPDVDSDGDGTYDCHDNCPNDPNKTEPGLCGCGVADTGDNDGDGVLDCVDLCPDDPMKITPGVCGCGEMEAPAGGYTIGGIVHIPLRSELDFFDGVPYIDIQLTCQNAAGNQLTDTCQVDGHTGAFSFDNVPCGLCSLSFRYKDTCEDMFATKICGEDGMAGAGQWINFDVNKANALGMSPCLQNIDVVATNNSYDILMSNQACKTDGGALCFDHVGRPSMSLSTSLIRLAGCFFNGACCGPAGAQALQPVGFCKCRYDCNNDEIFSVVSDLWCWTDCLVNGECHPDQCGDTPFPPGVGGAANMASTVGGIIFDDADNPLSSGIEGVRVDVIAADGSVIAGETNRIGVWVVEGLENGTYNVEFDGGKGTTTISVNNDNIEKNQSIQWHKKTNVRRLDGRRAATN